MEHNSETELGIGRPQYPRWKTICAKEGIDPPLQ